MDANKAYKALVRDIVRDQGDPELFDFTILRRAGLTDEQLVTVLRHHDHIMPEVVGDHLETMLGMLSTRDGLKNAIRTICETRALAAMKTDLECTASDMALEAEEDAKQEAHA